jgi:hypothetical protein
MLLSDFALLYGGDWQVAPVQIPFGSVVRIDSVVVTDTFGVRTLVPPYHADPNSARWRMFAPSGANDLLVLPAHVGSVTPTTDARGDILHAPSIADEEVPEKASGSCESFDSPAPKRTVRCCGSRTTSARA